MILVYIFFLHFVPVGISNFVFLFLVLLRCGIFSLCLVGMAPLGGI